MEMRTVDGLGDHRDESMQGGRAVQHLTLLGNHCCPSVRSPRPISCHIGSLIAAPSLPRSLMCVAVSGCDGACDVNSALDSLLHCGSLRFPPSSFLPPSLSLQEG